MVHYTPSYQDAYIHTKFEIPTSKNIKDMLQSQYLVTRSGQGYSDLIVVCDTQSSQDGLTHQIWNSNLKENKKNAPDSMQLLETRSEVKFTITVTQL